MASVLIVEDEETDRMILGNIAHGMGHEVHFASDGEEALKVYEGRSIDVVVTDLQMPNVDGLELIETLQVLFPDAKIIAVSGKGPALLAAAKEKGALVALSKPVDPHELLRAIAQAAPARSEQLSPRWLITR
jgi:CheY-like chemotaxis protein